MIPKTRFTFGILQLCTAMFFAVGCVDGELRGLGSLGKSEESESKDTKDADTKQPTEPRVDEPIWINGAALTCDWKSIESETSVGISCALKSHTGDELPPPDAPLAKNWVVNDAEGSAVSFARSVGESGEFDISIAIGAKEIPDSIITVWVVIENAAFDYFANFSDKLPKLEAGGPLATCLQDGRDPHVCFAEAGIDLSGGFAADSGAPAPVFLSCPSNFSAVPSTDNSGADNSFCAAKYEMKVNGAGKTVSSAIDRHKLVTSRTEAIAACEGMGPGYALMTNPEWMTIARSIEANPLNWERLQNTASGKLSAGHHEAAPDSLLPAAVTDSAGCFMLVTRCPGGAWSHEKRVFVLANDSVIWDFAGNAWEIVDFAPKIPEGDNTVFDISGKWVEFGNLKPIEGLADSDLRSTLSGLGSANGAGQFYISDLIAEPGGYTAVRGGSRLDLVETGIYSLAIASNSDLKTVPELGFRCVFHP
jgi:hypothetical protein